jgi:hypothetical protein
LALTSAVHRADLSAASDSSAARRLSIGGVKSGAASSIAATHGLRQLKIASTKLHLWRAGPSLPKTCSAPAPAESRRCRQCPGWRR